MTTTTVQSPEPQNVPLLSQPQCLVLREMLQGKSVTQAARTAQIHRSTVHRWLGADNFRLALENAQRENYLAVFFQVHTLAQPGLERLKEAIHSPKTSPTALLKIVQWTFTLLEKGQPMMQPSAKECGKITANLFDATLPDFQLDPSDGSAYLEPEAAKCDTPQQVAPASGIARTATAQAAECDTPQQGAPDAIAPVTEHVTPEQCVPQTAAAQCDTLQQSTPPERQGLGSGLRGSIEGYVAAS